MTTCTVLDTVTHPLPPRDCSERPRVKGKFFFIGDEKFLVKGVSYGAFRRNAAKEEYWDHALIERDFARMAANGINTVRIPHTMPPRRLLDAASRHGLRVIVGLSAEQYVGFLIDTDKPRPDIEGAVRSRVRTVAGHPALLCYAIGNEISASVARWLGAPVIERYLHGIYRAIKATDPDGIVTYVNYPSTEYLRLPFLDVVSFNVYLEAQDRLKAYLARLQSLAGDRPVLMSEVGLDALRNGEVKQAEVIAWQLSTIFAAGCAGVVIFAWTDEWHRAGAEVEDWAFGITDRQRRPKPALAAVARMFSVAPFQPEVGWPSISVVVCSYNGARTLDECLTAVCALSYPYFEVIVVNDGSTDATAGIAEKYPCRVITTENRGLSAARNLGAANAKGEIIAYIDDDAAPDPHWLHHLAHAFLTTSHVAVGGPNVLPERHGLTELCISKAPGGAQHVLITDELAEHVPGCNCAVRAASFRAIGGFDPLFRVAGDDVDFCWRLQERGWTIGFAPGAVVWHHRRSTVRGYLKQQTGYGKAEAMLEKKWPQRYNAWGHLTFRGKIYGGPTVHALFRRFSVYHGSGGFAPFQSLYERGVSLWGSLPLMPEWYLMLLLLAFVSVAAFFWEPLLVAMPLLALGLAVTLIHATKECVDVTFTGAPLPFFQALRARVVIAVLHVLQPLARLWGRLDGGLTAWRSRGRSGFKLPRRRTKAEWTGDWREPGARLEQVYANLRRAQENAAHGGEFDRWDLEVFGGTFGSARYLMAVEDHGAGTQYVRQRWSPRVRTASTAVTITMLVLAFGSGLGGEWGIAVVFAALVVAVVTTTVRQCGHAVAALERAATMAEAEGPSSETTEISSPSDETATVE